MKALLAGGFHRRSKHPQRCPVVRERADRFDAAVVRLVPDEVCIEEPLNYLRTSCASRFVASSEDLDDLVAVELSTLYLDSIECSSMIKDTSLGYALSSSSVAIRTRSAGGA
jgi:hypothetical protein